VELIHRDVAADAVGLVARERVRLGLRAEVEEKEPRREQDDHGGSYEEMKALHLLYR
jgi:hypothetical protein